MSKEIVNGYAAIISFVNFQENLMIEVFTKLRIAFDNIKTC